MKINEIADSETLAARKLVDYIKNNCQFWLSESDRGDVVLYRGIPYAAPRPYIIKKMPTDRRPKDSSKEQHALFNHALDLVGSVANRSNSVFATRDESVASGYGDVYITIPVGKFRYAWIDGINDLYADAAEFAVKAVKPEYQDIVTNNVFETFERLYEIWQSGAEVWNKEALYNLIWVDDGLYPLHLKNEEVMITGETVLYVHPVFYSEYIYPKL